MPHYFLGIDIGGSKCHALVADEHGKALGFASGGSGNWEYIGKEAYQAVMLEITQAALARAGISPEQVTAAGYGISGYDWPSQYEEHAEIIRRTGITSPIRIVNDSLLGLLAGSREGWGISIVAGTGNNCRGLNRDHTREGRLVGGEEWSWEFGGATDVVRKAMQFVSREWSHRGPASSLSQYFVEAKGARDLDDLIEGLYVKRYEFDRSDVLLVFKLANNGNLDAIKTLEWIGEQLGDLAVGVIRQLGLETQEFDAVLIGSLWQGSSILQEQAGKVIHNIAPGTRFIHLQESPVIGAVLLAMQCAGQDYLNVRKNLLESAQRKIV